MFVYSNVIKENKKKGGGCGNKSYRFTVKAEKGRSFIYGGVENYKSD